ncbi:hypothetical protein [uncultured Microscilla sp.]|uniref:hypothetical protein n=1 Tax=uncultured Microscilla sp. TaxID=432653 RepID=UPI002602B8A9|nr:hypothetical protein [uncultured Microscilla sp.]
MNNKAYKSMWFATVLAVFTLFLSSCEGGNPLTGGGAPDMALNNGEHLNELKKLLESKFGADKVVYELSLRSENHLTSEFGSAMISYLDKGVDYSQSYLVALGEGQELQAPKMASKNFQKKFFLKNKQGKVKLKELDFDLILTKYDEAIGMIPAEFENFELVQWNFRVNNQNKVAANFKIEGTKKGEKSTRQGRQRVTNYYEFSFKMNEKEDLKIAN